MAVGRAMIGAGAIFLLGLAATLAAALFLALAAWAARGRGEAPMLRATLAAALVATAGWAGLSGALPVESPLSALLETLRNGCWLAYMWALSASLGREHFPRSVRLIYKLLAILIVSLGIVQATDAAGMIEPVRAIVVTTLYTNLGLIVAAGLLVVVHNLYSIVSLASRRAFGPTLAVLTAMWAYDLNLYAIGLMSDLPAEQLIALRPALSLLLVPLLAIGWTQRDRARLTVSRRVAFQSLSLFAISAYLGAMALVANIVRSLGGDYGQIAQRVVLVAALAALLLLLPSKAFRDWLRVTISKHLFRHRYDYRAEWLRFTGTIGHPQSDTGPLQTRAIKAVADITGSPGGALLLPDARMVLTCDHRWRWADYADPAHSVPMRTALYLQESGRVIEFDALRELSPGTGERGEFPAWMIADDAIWVGLPLIHFGRLTGLLLLERPRTARRLDWEDFDLLKTVGAQVASYLSEAEGQNALSEARRFDEFNRRFAFIMHDIKNAVSQLSLVARNAERHADNPEFRKDMVETLNMSVARMNTLLARLSQHNKGKPSEAVALSLRSVVDNVVAQKRALHPLIAGVEQVCDALADRARVEQILGHLIQNAIDASAPDEPVQIVVLDDGEQVGIDVRDRGCGMTGEFVRDELFKAFASTKDGGFGIGAFEARALAAAMDGRIDVASRPGEGSVFTLWLPRAVAAASQISSRNDRTAA